MTRHVGYWLIGTALATTTLAGCAQTCGVACGRLTSQDTDCCRLLAFWQHAFQGRKSESETATTSSSDATITGPKVEPERGPVLDNSPPPNLGGAGDHDLNKVPAPPPQGVLTKGEPRELTEMADSPRVSSAAAIGLPHVDPDAPPLPQPVKADERAGSPFVIQGPHERSVPEPRIPLVEALHCAITNRHTEALELLRHYNQSTQEICLQLFPILALASQKPMEQWTPSEIDNLNQQLQSFSDSLRPRSRLTIGKACFCKWVKSYGIYGPLPETHAFRASTPTSFGEKVQLYVPLRNFASEKSKQGPETIYITRLTGVVEIRDHKDSKVREQRFPDEEPIRSVDLLTDWANTYCFNVPNDLPAGSYTLVIRVTDHTLANQPPRVAEARLSFRVTSMPGSVP